MKTKYRKIRHWSEENPKWKHQWLTFLHQNMETLPDEYKITNNSKKTEKNGERWLYLNTKARPETTYHAGAKNQRWKVHYRNLTKILGIEKLLQRRTEAAIRRYSS